MPNYYDVYSMACLACPYNMYYNLDSKKCVFCHQ